MNLKMKIMIKAVKIRVSNGEDLSSILESYPKLTSDEKQQIYNFLK